MNRRAFLKAIGSAVVIPILPSLPSLSRDLSTNFRRRRPSDSTWPSELAWKRLNDAVSGNLIPVNFPLSLFKTDPSGAAAERLSENLRNPYYIGDQPGLTQTLGWFIWGYESLWLPASLLESDDKSVSPTHCLQALVIQQSDCTSIRGPQERRPMRSPTRTTLR